MNFDINRTWDLVKNEVKETAEVTHAKTNEFHENYVSKVLPDCGKYGDAAKFVAEMMPGVSEYNAIKDGDWQALAIAAGIDLAALAVGAVTAGVGYAAVKGGTTVAKTGVKVAVKEVAKAGAKKVITETAETGMKKAVKEAVETGVEKAAKETVEAGAEKAVKETVEAGAEKVIKETAEAGTEKVVKETVEGGSEKVAKEVVEAGTEKVGKVEKIEQMKEGGSYKEVRKNSNGEIEEVHHMPADDISPLDRNDGPAIKMDKTDHRETASWGSSIEAREYRAAQREKIEKGDFRGALQMDIDDIMEKFPNKYDEAIKQMLEYVDKLELGGLI